MLDGSGITVHRVLVSKLNLDKERFTYLPASLSSAHRLLWND